MTKPSSYSGKSPYIPAVSIPAEPQQLAAPEAFSRPINAANSFTLFDLIKVQDMEDLCDPPYPKMPPVLTTHDIYHDDWKRCMQVSSTSYAAYSNLKFSSGFGSLLDRPASCSRTWTRRTSPQEVHPRSRSSVTVESILFLPSRSRIDSLQRT